MNIRTLLGFEFSDGLVTMHVAVKEYVGQSGTTYRVSWHNSVCEIGYTSDSYGDKVEAMDEGVRIRKQCYADMASFLQQVM